MAEPGMTARTSVLLAMASPALRAGLSDELSLRGPCTFLDATSYDESEQVATDHGPGDLAMIDMSLGDGDHQDHPTTDADTLVRVLRVQGWDHVVAVGDRTRLDDIGATLLAGARAYLFSARPGGARPDGARSHGTTAHEALRNGIPEPRPGTEAARRIPVPDSAGEMRELSHREVEVLRFAAEGMGNAEIGHALGLSALTVKSHLARMTHRLRARDRAHLVLLVLRAGAIR